MNRRVEVVSSHAGRGWRMLQMLGFLSLAAGLALAWMTWPDRATGGAPMVGVLMALAGLAVYLAARGMTRLLHG